MENIVLSTRIRLARNFKDYPFISKISKEDALKITNEVKEIILSSNSSSPLYFSEIEENELKQEGLKLVENHLISPNILNSKVPSSVILDKNKEISIMINEEDHLRIQVIKEGFNLDEAFSLANACDDLIEESKEYAFSEKYGYLTSCPTNTGTGLRASVMIHIPAIVMCGKINELTENVNRLGIAIRGYYGEGSGSFGNIYQISNQTTLGISEEEIIEKIKNVTTQIVKQEENLRNLVLNDNLKDKIMRSYGILKNCYLINYKEFSGLWSMVYLGINMGIITNTDKNSFVKLISSLAPGSIGEDDAQKRDKLRAKILKDVI